MLRLYFDEHLDLVIVSQLRLRGVDVVAAQEVDRANQKIPDHEQLAYATSEGRVMVSKDRDFVTLGDVLIYETGQTSADWREALEAMRRIIGVTSPA